MSPCQQGVIFVSAVSLLLCIRRAPELPASYTRA